MLFLSSVANGTFSLQINSAKCFHCQNKISLSLHHSFSLVPARYGKFLIILTLLLLGYMWLEFVVVTERSCNC